jgi:hypothetical protein
MQRLRRHVDEGSCADVLLLRSQREFSFPSYEVQHCRIGAVCADSSWPEENPNATTFSASSLKRVRLRMPFSGMGTSVSMFSKKVGSTREPEGSVD